MTRRTLPPAHFALLALALASACDGVVEGPARPSDQRTSVGPADGPGGNDAAAFELNRTSPKLLPFKVRLGKVAAVLGVSPESAVLEPVRARRVSLGDYDFANGVLPDTAWTASRMSEWVRALRPVCTSQEFTSKYPNLPEQLPELIEAAYGRESTTDDLADYDQELEDPSLDDAERHELTCLAVLSAAEMVIQ